MTVVVVLSSVSVVVWLVWSWGDRWRTRALDALWELDSARHRLRAAQRRARDAVTELAYRTAPSVGAVPVEAPLAPLVAVAWHTFGVFDPPGDCSGWAAPDEAPWWPDLVPTDTGAHLATAAAEAFGQVHP